jgi:hypothetical protein
MRLPFGTPHPLASCPLVLALLVAIGCNPAPKQQSAALADDDVDRAAPADAAPADCGTGDLGCECYPNQTCNGVLECVDERCERGDGADDDTATLDDDTATPDDDTATPDGDTATPDGDTATPDSDTATPDDDTATPDDDVSSDAGPDDDQPGDDDIPLDADVSGDDDTTAMPDGSVSDDDLVVDSGSAADDVPTDDDLSDDDVVVVGDDLVPECTNTFHVDSTGYVTAPGGSCWQGYASTSAGENTTVSPSSFASCGSPCSLCFSGTVGATEDFSGLAYLGFSMAQLADRSVKGNGTALIGSSITVDVSNPLGVPLRVQLSGNSSTRKWCKDISGQTGTIEIPFGAFVTECWDGGEHLPITTESINAISLVVPGNDHDDLTFDVCLNSVEH